MTDDVEMRPQISGVKNELSTIIPDNIKDIKAEYNRLFALSMIEHNTAEQSQQLVDFYEYYCKEMFKVLNEHKNNIQLSTVDERESIVRVLNTDYSIREEKAKAMVQLLHNSQNQPQEMTDAQFTSLSYGIDMFDSTHDFATDTDMKTILYAWADRHHEKADSIQVSMFNKLTRHRQNSFVDVNTDDYKAYLYMQLEPYLNSEDKATKYDVGKPYIIPSAQKNAKNPTNRLITGNNDMLRGHAVGAMDFNKTKNISLKNDTFDTDLAFTIQGKPQTGISDPESIESVFHALCNADYTNFPLTQGQLGVNRYYFKIKMLGQDVIWNPHESFFTYCAEVKIDNVECYVLCRKSNNSVDKMTTNIINIYKQMFEVNSNSSSLHIITKVGNQSHTPDLRNESTRDKLIDCCFAFKRAADRIYSFYAFQKNLLLDNSDTYARYYLLLLILCFKPTTGSLIMLLSQLNKPNGQKFWKEKYMKYKNKYLALKKKLYNN
jgi:hypothetical protein